LQLEHQSAILAMQMTCVQSNVATQFRQIAATREGHFGPVGSPVGGVGGVGGMSRITERMGTLDIGSNGKGFFGGFGSGFGSGSGFSGGFQKFH
jgi:hypothetical protein